MAERSTWGQGTALDALCLTAEALLANTSETASLALAELVVRRYGELKRVERRDFMMFLLRHLGASRPEVDLAIDRYRRDGTELSLTQLFQAAEARRQALFLCARLSPPR